MSLITIWTYLITPRIMVHTLLVHNLNLLIRLKSIAIIIFLNKTLVAFSKYSRCLKISDKQELYLEKGLINFLKIKKTEHLIVSSKHRMHTKSKARVRIFQRKFNSQVLKTYLPSTNKLTIEHLLITLQTTIS